MKEKFSFTKGKLIAFICCSMLPIIVSLFGILCLITKTFVVNFSFAISYFVISIIAICLLACCIFSMRKTVSKVILSMLILILFVIIFTYSSFLLGFVSVDTYKGKEAELEYIAAMKENTLMPALSDLGSCETIEYHDVFAAFYIFSSETDHLICRYSSDEYEIQKAALESKYAFQTKKITERYSEWDPSTEIDGYCFRLLSLEEYEDILEFPKIMILIGYSDAAREIVYIEFENIDLDYITSLKDFINNECGWKYVR